MRFAVLGNCQTGTIADCIALYFPGAEVVRYASGNPATAERAAGIAEELHGFDHVFAHAEMSERMGPLRHAILRETHPRTVFMPGVAFSGFQPDCIYLADAKGTLPSPVEVYHSALAAAAFTLGLEEERAVSLFNALVFSRLGYFDEHAKASGAMVAHFRRMGYEIGERLPLWQRDRPFMYTINHPRCIVLADIARLALEKAGFTPPEMPDVSDVLGDPLSRMPIFPLYPEIGRRLGLPGHYFFRDTIRGDQPMRPLDLPLFVARSFEIYRGMPERVSEAVERHPRAKPAAEALKAMLRLG
ncbi:hypothetical protein J8J14_03795 [Roseomonas sp. SSH11]|uniref:Polysaccharide biosynthesis enzyme WcbI domain-containing protein n=1 Tax=Pararoseomonas baculiformis TaxID=2820812 RepID=A0ABS4AA70_9PROT|nr:WcbI family polysaccharide biosynthesis putative acetyltransferase [Pararoseomonas baculiformis]MBP0443894.1 hypothetical protein [Pararoseomonas baculiformis]